MTKRHFARGYLLFCKNSVNLNSFCMKTSEANHRYHHVLVVQHKPSLSENLHPSPHNSATSFFLLLSAKRVLVENAPNLKNRHLMHRSQAKLYQDVIRALIHCVKIVRYIVLFLATLFCFDLDMTKSSAYLM